MNPTRASLCAIVLPLLLGATALGADTHIKPVTPDAMPETVALLAVLQDISGHYTLTGQHNLPASGDRNSRFAAKYIGKARQFGPATSDSRPPETRTPT
jgi:hypothetical protein